MHNYTNIINSEIFLTFEAGASFVTQYSADWSQAARWKNLSIQTTDTKVTKNTERQRKQQRLTEVTIWCQQVQQMLKHIQKIQTNVKLH